MIKVLLVDDELEIRKGLHLKVNWQQLGFEIAAEAIHGADAIEKLEEQPFDIVITDMNMPIMDGVALLSHIQQHYPSIKSIVLTGYDDFEYTKAAIRHRAIEYLLKPVMPDELEQVILQLKDIIMKERHERISSLESSRRQQRWYMEIRENFALHMLKGDLSPIILNKAPLIAMEEWDSDKIQVVTFGLKASHNLLMTDEAATSDESKKQQGGNAVHAAAGKPHSGEHSAEQFQLPFELIARELVEHYSEQALICKDSNYPNLVSLVCRDGQVQRQHMIETMLQEVKQHLGFELVLGISKQVCGFSQWYHAYMDALLQWSLSNSELHQANALHGQISKLDDEVLLRLLQKDEPNSVLQYIRKILTDAIARSNTDFVRQMFEVLITLERLLQEHKTIVAPTDAIWLNPERVLKLTTVDKALSYIQRYLQEREGSKKQESSEDIFQEVLQYIDQNYVYDISLPSLAEKFNYNTSYFSELFKAKVGKTFVQYLSDVRMKQACHLLETTDLGLSDIAELTGFSNASYFSSRFKKCFQIAPSEYRLQNSNNSSI